MKKSTFKVSALLSVFAIAFLIVFNACDKEKSPIAANPAIEKKTGTTVSITPTLTQILTVANVRTSADGNTTQVMFNKNEEIFTIQDAAMITGLRQALNNKSKVKVIFDPWHATITQVTTPSSQEIAALTSSQIVNSPSTAVYMKEAGAVDKMERMAAVSLTSTGLTNVIPDMATAQLMFNYISKQCCALPGPYGVDYCISFQYAEDGCYARAQKMCYILNTKYHYDTHKIFSFANAGSDELSVQAQKWGGCCVNWWYHVAPLVNIKTPTGPKAYVFDPAMFDQPVLLSAWLHAQENPACSGGYTPNVSMINLQPTTSYSPADGTGFAFDTDPMFYDTDATLSAYAPLLTCP